ncbi:MAG: methyltransferase domain-containing protein [Anaerolineae bacterium]|nr:methyltransferase domain-containing protein [Anaerolineae bacterium]
MALERSLLARWVDLLACPRCQGALAVGQGAHVTCGVCGERYAVDGLAIALLPPERAAAYATFGRTYREARLREGWRPLTREQLLALPHDSPPGYPALYWRVRRESYRALLRLLEAEGPPPDAGPVADLGAGVGWLAFRLAQIGYHTLAVDASVDDAFGLGAAAPYLERAQHRLLLVQGDLEHPPLRAGAWSAAILNASLHYARDLDAALREVTRALRPGGRLIVMDSPIARIPVSGTGRGDRHLGTRELDAALERAGLRPRWIRVWRGARWWVHQGKAWLRQSGSFSFPLVVAER